MKTLNSKKYIFILVFLLVANIIISAFGLNTFHPAVSWTGVFFISTILFSILFRRYLWFKPFLTSNLNILSSKVRRKQEFDFPYDLLFEKVTEILSESDFEIIESNRTTGQILAISELSALSNGETIYITILEKNGTCHLDFISASPQIFSYGKHKRNYDNLLLDFEKSLTI